MDELDEYMDPCYGIAESQLPNAALTDIVLSRSEECHQQHQRLLQLQQLRPVLDSQPIRGLPFF